MHHARVSRNKKMEAGDRFELPMHLAYETGVVASLPAICGAPRQNRTAITGLQNQCTTIVLVGLIVGLGSRNRTYAPASQTQSDTISPY